MRSTVIAGAVLSGVLAGDALFADENNLSRLTVRVSSDTVFHKIFDVAALHALCADDDGCEVVINLRSEDFATTNTGRLFVLVAAKQWYCSESGNLFENGDLAESTVLSSSIAFGFCSMGDGDTALGDDTDMAFDVSLLITGGATTTACIVTLSD
jgi:hypothetical protein